MDIGAALEFTHVDRKRIYEYVEAHGSVSYTDLERDLHLEPRGVRHHVAILKRDGYLEPCDGGLRVAFEHGTIEEHHTDVIDFSIRVADQSDLSGLVGAIRQVAEDGAYIEAESVADVIDHESVLLRHNELESRMFFVATVADDVVGWVHLSVPEQAKLHHTAVLTVGVLEEYRGHGIGSHLLERGVNWASQHGFEKLYNSVPATNEDAIAFLEDHGWETEAIRTDHYKIDDEYVDEVMMRRRL